MFSNDYSDTLFPLQKPETRKWIFLGKLKIHSILPKINNKIRKKFNSPTNKTNPTLINDYMSFVKRKNQSNDLNRINQNKLKSYNNLRIRNISYRETPKLSPFISNEIPFIKNKKKKNDKVNNTKFNIKNIVFDIKGKNLSNSFEDNYIFYLTKKYYEKYKDRNYSTINKLRKTEKKMKINFIYQNFFSKKSF